MPLPFNDVFMRLAAGAALGGIIGINRELQRKPAGFRTHAMVSLGATLMTIAGLGLMSSDTSSLSRILQGLVAGIGFVGGGAILRSQEHPDAGVHGLTTASSIWVVAAIGITAGLGMWEASVTATAIALVLLTLGERVDRWLRKLTRQKD